MIKRPLAIVTGSASSTQAITTATWTAIQFDSEVRDEWGWHDNSTNNTRITVDRDGVYRVSGVATFDTTSGTAQIKLRVRVNAGATFTGVRGTTRYVITDPLTPTVSGSGLVDLSAGDYVELEVKHDLGSNYNVQKDNSQLAAEWVSY